MALFRRFDTCLFTGPLYQFSGGFAVAAPVASAAEAGRLAAPGAARGEQVTRCRRFSFTFDD